MGNTVMGSGRKGFCSVVALAVFLFLSIWSSWLASAEGTNLILNPSLEQSSLSGKKMIPTNWKSDRWWTNTAVFTYPASGYNGSKGAEVKISSYTRGDAKWSFDPVSVTPGSVYQFSDRYKSDTATELVIEYKKNDNTLSYETLGDVPASTTWSTVGRTLTVPTWVRSLTVLHILKSVGTLTVDDVSLSILGETLPTPPSNTDDNLIPNASTETSSNSSIPDGWMKGGWGKNTKTFTYPIDGYESVKWLRTQISAYTNGDAKWYFKHVPVIPGKKYEFSDYYQSDVATEVSLEYILQNGKYSYQYLSDAPASSEWTKYSYSFTPPSQAKSVTVFHLINRVGYLNTDNYRLALSDSGTVTPPNGSGSTNTGSTNTGSTNPPVDNTGSTNTGSTDTGSTADTTAPIISLLLSDGSYTGAIHLSAAATDNIGISSVIFLVDSGSVGTGIVSTGSSDTYELLFDSTTIPNGSHTISVRASDAAGNVNMASKTITVDNPIPDTIAPVVSITSPGSGAVLSGTSTVSISASDSGGVAFVHYSITNGNDLITGQMENAPYMLEIPITALGDGDHTITVYAQDKTWNIGNADPVTFSTITSSPPPTSSSNLIRNSDFESGSGSFPDHWFHGGWGTNTASFGYPTTGADGSKAAEVSIDTYTDGDAKWYFEDVAVESGKTYAYSDQYKSTTSSILTARFTYVDGTMTYSDILPSLPATSDWVTASQNITIPANATKLTIFHLIKSVGTLDIDNASLVLSASGSSGGSPGVNAFDHGMVTLSFDDGWGSQYDSAFPLLNNAGIKGSFYIITNEMKNAINANRIENSSFEITESGGTLSHWTPTRTGNNDATFSYPVPGVSGKAAQVTIASYSSGDAGWIPEDTTIVEGEPYNFTDQYMASVPGIITARYTFEDGTTRVVDIGTTLPSSTWRIASFTFTPPANVKSMTIYHRLKRDGTLTVDDYRLDLAQDYMNTAQVEDVYKAGHEVSSHTLTHPFLTSISTAQATSEITQSKKDLIDLGITPSETFVYPYGLYDDSIINITKNAGYIGARSVDQGYNTKASDKYTLKIQEVNSSTGPAQWESWIQTAIANKTWLIFMFHQIDHQNDQYGATPEDFATLLDYLGTNKIPTVTMNEGIKMMSPTNLASNP